MSNGGYGAGSSDPFGGEPTGASAGAGGPGYGSGAPGFAAPGYRPGYPGANQGFSGQPGFFDGPAGGFGAPSSPPRDEVNTLSTLSIVFAIVFAPAGAALGHLALHQIRLRGQRGRERALIGLTLSYVVIVAAIIALVVWLVSTDDAASTAATATTTTETTMAAPPPRTTVITAPPPVRQSVTVGDLAVGDCVEVQQYERVPGDPNTTMINIYRTPCVVRDGVVHVDQLTSARGQCPTTLVISNPEDTIFACISDFKG